MTIPTESGSALSGPSVAPSSPGPDGVPVLPDLALVPDPLLLPERARLLQIGPPKTATTAVQHAAAARRAELLAHGVRYPGTARTHRSAIAAFIGRPIAWVAAKDVPPPDRHYWDDLMAEVEADRTNRILLGHEYAAGADDETAARLVAALGPRTHVVITLRSYGAMLPSIWQEHSKAGNVEPFEAWLKRSLHRPRTQKVFERFHVRHDQGLLVQRWAAAAGADNVTVVVLDPSRPAAVFSVFERMLGLPPGQLVDLERPANRSLSVPEIELMRRLNSMLRTHDVTWPEYQRIVVEGVAGRLVAGRRPGADEARLRLPDWAADVADAEARRHVEEIRASGVRVVGDLELLATPAPRRTDPREDHTTVTDVPLELAVTAVEGAVSAALARGWDFTPVAGRPVVDRRVSDVRSLDLLRVVRDRTVRAVRRRLGRPGR